MAKPIKMADEICQQIRSLEESVKICGSLSPAELIITEVLNYCSSKVCARIAKTAIDKAVAIAAREVKS
jgi:hypothetical protein